LLTKRDLGWFEYALASEGREATRMTFTQHFGSDLPYSETVGDLGGDLPAGPGTPWKPGFVGGFHQMFDHLGEMLAGHEIGSRLGDSALRAIASEWAKRKVQNDQTRSVVRRTLRARVALGRRMERAQQGLSRFHPHTVPAGLSGKRENIRDIRALAALHRPLDHRIRPHLCASG
jgi:hypothetical protein